MAESLSARYAKTDISRRLGSPTAGEREFFQRIPPSIYARPFSRLTGMFRTPHKALRILGIPAAISLTYAVIMMVFATDHGEHPPAPYFIGGSALGMYLFFVWIMTDMSFLKDKDAMAIYRADAPRVVGRVTFPHLQVRDIEMLSRRVKKLMDRPDPEYAAIQRHVATSFAEIGAAYDRLVGQIGEKAARPAREDAVTTFHMILERAEREAGAIRQDLKRRASIAAAPVIEQFSLTMASIAAGTVAMNATLPLVSADARTNRLIEAGRRAIELDPGMTDGAGAPIAALVERHLPALLQRHAEAARHGRLEDLDGIDRNLEEGLDLVRASIEEGLSRARGEAADELRQEIAFLRMRRAESPF